MTSRCLGGVAIEMYHGILILSATLYSQMQHIAFPSFGSSRHFILGSYASGTLKSSVVPGRGLFLEDSSSCNRVA